MPESTESLRLTPDRLDGIEREPDETPIEDATWYVSRSTGDELVYEFEAGELADYSYVTYDLFLDGTDLAKFQLGLRESETDRRFTMNYGAVNRCEGRVRIALEATDQNRWKHEREGAWLNPVAGGDRVDVERVDELSVRVVRKSDEPVRWCQTAVTVTAEEPPRIAHPTLPDGPVLDEFGQSTVREWDGRTESEEELISRLEEQREAAADAELPDNTSRWGGWEEREFEATGFFRTAHDGRRWWLVDPDGHPFWSTGLDVVRPFVGTAYDGLEDALAWLPDADSSFADALSTTTNHEGDHLRIVNHVAANLRRAFGDDWYDAWTEIVLAQNREWGFNTVANWSDWEIAAEAGVPYVRPLVLRFEGVETIFREFPDVYHPDFHEAAATYAEQLEDTVDDPALIGYFLGNEPTWTFASETPAAGMLYTTETCETRRELAAFLAQRRGDDAGLADAWGMDVTLSDVASGRWDEGETLTEAAESDLEEFSAIMVDRLYRVVCEACHEVDPNHLNLGTRYPGLPRDWALAGMHHVDVFSINCYQERPGDRYAEVSERLDLPVLIGEWHFGALDAGLPAPGLMHVPDQESRGEAYRIYVEDGASQPWCVGTHYFTLYDEPALGRFDGENWNIGFLDVCNRPYEPLCSAARATHERLYEVAIGEQEPYEADVEYLPRLA